MKNIICAFGMLGGLASAQVEVKVAGLKVVGPAYKGEGDEKNNSGLRAFNWSSGTKVALLLKSAEKSIVLLDKDGSKVSTFGDDKGTDFTKIKSRYSSRSVSFGFPQESKDGKALMVEVSSDGVPAAGAGYLMLKGELVVSVASASKLTKTKKLPVKKGTEVTVGEKAFKMSEAGKPKWGDAPLAITLEGKVSPKQFKEIKFFDVKGKEIEADESSSGSSGMFGKMTYTVTYNLKKKVEKVIVGFDEWTDLEVIKVPLDHKIGAGL